MSPSSEDTEHPEKTSQDSPQDTQTDPPLGPPVSQPPRTKSEEILPIALSAAVPLWIYEIYERSGPTAEDWQWLRAQGRVLAERGDVLLFGSPRAGETAELFNTLAKVLAILSFLPGGVPFGKERFDALAVLTGFLGEEQARTYISHIRRQAASG